MKKISTSSSVKSVVELIDCWRDLQTSLEDNFLSLEPDVLWPSHEMSQVPLRLDMLTCRPIKSRLLGKTNNPVI